MLVGNRSFVSALIVLMASWPSIVNAQSGIQISAGVGMGPTSAPGIPAAVVFADAKWMVAPPLKLGAEIWYASNHDRTCLVVPLGRCLLTFPDFVGIAPTVSIGFGGDLVDVGVGPGLFERYFAQDDNALVGGVVAHLNAAIVRSRYVNVILSVRPFVGPKENGRTSWIVPIMIGLSR